MELEKSAEMTFIRKKRAFNVDEIDTFSQLHQNFTSSFCADILSTRITKSNCKNIKASKKHFHMKKLFVKCWWNWHLSTPSWLDRAKFFSFDSIATHILVNKKIGFDMILLYYDSLSFLVNFCCDLLHLAVFIIFVSFSAIKWSIISI